MGSDNEHQHQTAHMTKQRGEEQPRSSTPQRRFDALPSRPALSSSTSGAAGILSGSRRRIVPNSSATAVSAKPAGGSATATTGAMAPPSRDELAPLYDDPLRAPVPSLYSLPAIGAGVGDGAVPAPPAGGSGVDTLSDLTGRWGDAGVPNNNSPSLGRSCPDPTEKAENAPESGTAPPTPHDSASSKNNFVGSPGPSQLVPPPQPPLQQPSLKEDRPSKVPTFPRKSSFDTESLAHSQAANKERTSTEMSNPGDLTNSSCALDVDPHERFMIEAAVAASLAEAKGGGKPGKSGEEDEIARAISASLAEAGKGPKDAGGSASDAAGEIDAPARLPLSSPGEEASNNVSDGRPENPLRPSLDAPKRWSESSEEDEEADEEALLTAAAVFSGVPRASLKVPTTVLGRHTTVGGALGEGQPPMPCSLFPQMPAAPIPMTSHVVRHVSAPFLNAKPQMSYARSEALDDLVSNVADTRSELRRQMSSSSLAYFADLMSAMGERPDDSVEVADITTLVAESFQRLVRAFSGISDALELVSMGAQRSGVTELASSEGSESGSGDGSERINAAALHGLLAMAPPVNLAFSGIKPVLVTLSNEEPDEIDDDLADGMERLARLVDILTEIAGKVSERQEWSVHAEAAFVTVLCLVNMECDALAESFEGGMGDSYGVAIGGDGACCESGPEGASRDRMAMLRRAWTVSGKSEQLAKVDAAGAGDDLGPGSGLDTRLFQEVAIEVIRSTGIWAPDNEEDLLFACHLACPIPFLGANGEGEGGSGDSTGKDNKPKEVLSDPPEAVLAILGRLKASKIPRDRDVVDKIVKRVVPPDALALRRGSSRIPADLDQGMLSEGDPTVVVVSTSPKGGDGAPSISRGGTGKTTAAAMAACRDEVRWFFQGGIAWIEIGRDRGDSNFSHGKGTLSEDDTMSSESAVAEGDEKNLEGCLSYSFYVNCLRTICAQLKVDPVPEFDDMSLVPFEKNDSRRRAELRLMNRAKEIMIDILSEMKNTLIVLDDVCRAEDVDWFNFYPDQKAELNTSSGNSEGGRLRRRKSGSLFRLESGSDLNFLEDGQSAEASGRSARRGSGSIFGLKRRGSGTRFAELLATAKKPSRVLVTTRLPLLRPSAVPVISVDALQETEASELLMTESGQPSNHVLRTSDEVRAIVRACDENHALTIRTAGRWIRMEQASGGVIKAVEEVARCVEDAQQQQQNDVGAFGNRPKNMSGLFDILELALTCVAPGNKPQYIKRCFAALVVLFCRNGGNASGSGEEGFQSRIPLCAAKALWGKLLVHTDAGEPIEEGDSERLEDMATTTMRISEVLASLGMINIEYEENTDGSINRWLKLNHELHMEYGEFLVSDPSGGIGEMNENFEQFWNEAFVAGYYEVMGDKNWKDMTPNGDLIYGVEMIVSHMLRAGMLEEARTLLCSEEFVWERVLVMGPEAGTRRHVRDCKDFSLRAKDDPEVGSDEFYMRDTLFLAYERVSTCLSEKITAGRSGRGDEELALEVGKAFQELGLSYSEQDSDDCLRTAISFYEKASEYVRDASGDVEFVATAMFNIACIELRRKMFEKAKDRLLETLSIRSNYLADEDVRIVKTLRKLGDVLAEMDQKGEATKLYQEAIDLAKSDLQSNRLLVSNILQNKGLLHHEIGELNEAVDAFEESLQWRTMELGNNDPVLALTHYSIGNVLVAQGKQEEAIPSFEESIRLRKLRPAENAMVAADLLSAEGMLWNMKGNKPEALRCLKEVVRICESLGLENDLRVAQIRHEIGELHFAQGEYKEAAESFNLTMQVRKEKLGEQELEVFQAQYRTGCALGHLDAVKALNSLSEALGGLQLKLGENHEEVALALHEIAKIHERERNYSEAASWLRKEVDVLRAVHGNDSESLAIAHLDLGLVEEHLGNFSKAIDHFDEVHRIKELTCESNHLDMAEIKYKLAVVNEKLSNYDAAMGQLEDALRVRVTNLGYNNSIVAETINLIGKIHLSRGNYESALQSFNEVLGLEFEFNDSDRVGVANTVFGKGCVYYCRGELSEAMKSYEESLYWMKMVLGENDPALAPIHHKMGNIHADKGDEDEAVHCFEESIRLRESKKEMTTEDEADVQSLRGVLYRMQGDDEKALQCFHQALNSCKMIFGPDNDKVANLEHNIACIYVATDQDDKAIELFQESLRARRKFLGNAHLDVACTLFNMAFVYIRRENDYRNALKCLEESLQIRQKQLGKCDKVALTLEKCGNTCKALGDHDGALNYYEDALAMKRILHGDDHETVASTLHEMGDLMDEIGEFGQAMKCFDEALDIRQRRLGDDHPDVAATLYAKGYTFDQEGEYESALACFEESVKIRRSHYGKDHYTVGDTLDIMGCVFAKMGDSEKALRHLWDALASRKMCMDHLKVAATLQNIGNVHKKRREFDQAVECYDECLRVRTLKLGADHDNVGDAWIALGNVHTEADQIEDAANCYEEAARIKRLNHETDELKVAPSLYLFGMMLVKSGDWERAKQQLDDFLRIRQSGGQVYDEEYASALAFVGDAYSVSGEKSKAVLNWTEALSIYKAYGLTEEHPSVVRVMKNLENGSSGSKSQTAAKSWMERLSAGLGDEHIDAAQDTKRVECNKKEGGSKHSKKEGGSKHSKKEGGSKPSKKEGGHKSRSKSPQGSWMKRFSVSLSDEVRR